VTEYPNGFVEMSLTNHFNRQGSNIWRPLLDDGDALRLAVKLRLNVHITSSGTSAVRGTLVDIFDLTSGSEQKHGDASLATRRAIVRAAAEVGKRTI
jgi:hypothetical protein